MYFSIYENIQYFKQLGTSSLASKGIHELLTTTNYNKAISAVGEENQRSAKYTIKKNLNCPLNDLT